MPAQTTKGNEQQSQQSGGQTLTQGSQRQGAPSRQTGYALGLPLTPAAFFRMNPFTLMRRMTEEFDRVFGEAGWREQTERAWMPAIDVRQTGDNYVVRAELPGISPGDVKTEITDDAIVIEGERKMEREEEEGGVHVTERRYGRFYRAIPLPEGARSDEARAKFENGVLEITVPVEEQRSKRREIPIEGTSAQAGKPAASTESRGGSEKAA